MLTNPLMKLGNVILDYVLETCVCFGVFTVECEVNDYLPFILHL